MKIKNFIFFTLCNAELIVVALFGTIFAMISSLTFTISYLAAKVAGSSGRTMQKLSKARKEFL